MITETKLKFSKEQYRECSRVQFYELGEPDSNGTYELIKAAGEFDPFIWEYIDQANEMGFAVCIGYYKGTINTYVGKYRAKHGQGGGVFGEISDMKKSISEYFEGLFEQIAKGELDHMPEDDKN